MVVRVRVSLGKHRRNLEVETIPKVRTWLGRASWVSFAVALWRLAFDLSLTGHFAFQNGLFSHWQLWMALALVLQLVDSGLGRRGHGGAATP